jgi:hypothetical protein
MAAHKTSKKTKAKVPAAKAPKKTKAKVPAILDESEAVIQRVYMLVSDGLNIEEAARAIDVSSKQLRAFADRGKAIDTAIEEGEKPKLSSTDERCLSLYRSVEKARIDFKARSIRRILDAGDKNWKAAAWLLENCVDEFKKDKPSIKATITNNIF